MKISQIYPFLIFKILILHQPHPPFEVAFSFVIQTSY